MIYEISPLLKEISLTTSNFPSVIVPVLSKHATSTLASISIQYKSCTNTFFLDNLITLTARTVEVSKTNPSGIIPIIPATVEVIASLKLFDALY